MIEHRRFNSVKAEKQKTVDCIKIKTKSTVWLIFRENNYRNKKKGRLNYESEETYVARDRERFLSKNAESSFANSEASRERSIYRLRKSVHERIIHALFILSIILCISKDILNLYFKNE